MHTRTQKRLLPSLLFLALIAGVAPCLTRAAEPIKIPMTPDRWTVTGEGGFSIHDGQPVLELKPGNYAQHLHTGNAVLNNFNFRNGTIEFDVLATGNMGAGFGFRRTDDQNFEDFYLRPHDNCDKAEDCIQYAPNTHGVLLWDLFPQYQSPAPIKNKEWNHLKFVINGQRMNIYVNGAKSPTFQIGSLEGDSLDGGILMQGPGVFSNLVIAPDATEGLSPDPLPDATASDNHLVRRWQLSPYSDLADGKEPAFADLPASTAAWQPIAAERNGLIDISRVYGLPLPRAQRSFAWLKTTIHSDSDQTRAVQFGWAREAWVFVNGKLIYADKNLYPDAKMRKAPDGRCSLRNGGFQLPLKRGDNEIDIALADNFYGWAIQFRLDDVKKLRVAGE